MSSIDWTQFIIRTMKDAAVVAAQLVVSKGELAARNAQAMAQIVRIHDGIDTIGYGIDIPLPSGGVRVWSSYH